MIQPTPTTSMPHSQNPICRRGAIRRSTAQYIRSGAIAAPTMTARVAALISDAYGSVRKICLLSAMSAIARHTGLAAQTATQSHHVVQPTGRNAVGAVEGLSLMAAG